MKTTPDQKRVYAKQGYTKLFQKILYSTIWSEDDKTRIVWITLLAMCDSEGNVMASLPGLARAANVDLKATELALKKFMSPDRHSTTEDHEGRRIERIDGGWRLLNHSKYKEMMTLEYRREYNRLKQAEYRTKGKIHDKEKTIRDIVREKSEARDFLERNK